MTKTCTKCGETKPLEAFYKKRDGRHGRAATCSQCHNAIMAAQRLRYVDLPKATEKRCARCREVKSAAEYDRSSSIKDGLHTYCKPCRTALLRYHRYELEPGQLEDLIERQDGRCAICSTETLLVVDHCHNSGQVRGLLCDQCNHAIGKLKDDPELLMRAAEYVLRYRDVLAVR